MILRIEDIDRARCKKEYEDAILDDLRFLGLTWDEGPDIGGPFGPYRQSERRDVYDRAITRLKDQGLVYPCFCSRKELANLPRAPHAEDAETVYPGLCADLTAKEAFDRRQPDRTPSLRLRVPDREFCFNDLLFGCRCGNPRLQCGDFAVRRADGVVAYQLAVVADDASQGVTEVVRGADLLDSTPRQLYLYELLGSPSPRFGHVPLLVAKDGTRLAKRHKRLDFADLRQAGLAPEAIVGFLAFKAGLLDRPQKASPAELLSVFRFNALPTEPVVLTEGGAGAGW